MGEGLLFFRCEGFGGFLEGVLDGVGEGFLREMFWDNTFSSDRNNCPPISDRLKNRKNAEVFLWMGMKVSVWIDFRWDWCRWCREYQ